jgi:hypothetical protein
MTGWWCNVPILKNDGVKVNGFQMTDIPYMKWKIKNVWNHQPVYFYDIWLDLQTVLWYVICIYMFNDVRRNDEYIYIHIWFASGFYIAPLGHSHGFMNLI